MTEVHKTATSILAGGCFWGVEELIRQLPGVIATQVGYTGGDTENPNYQTVKTGKTGHCEAIEIKFDPQKLKYYDLLHYFFRLHDPTTRNRQGNDVGSQYRSAIFYVNSEQKQIAECVITEVKASGKWPQAIVTEIIPAAQFFPAEDYHQKYLQQNPTGYTCHFLREN